MKVICDVCKQEYECFSDVIKHRHIEYELNGVPCNFWSVIRNDLQPEMFEPVTSNSGVFKYENLFPKIPVKLSLNEGDTPLYEIDANVLIKDESRNPTGSFKDRGMPLLMNEVLINNKLIVATVSTGNAAISMAKYSKLFDIKTFLFISKDTEKSKLDYLSNLSIELFFSENLIYSFEDYFAFCRRNSEVYTGYLSANPSYLLGLETLSYEMYFQLKKKAPDYILIPCASGSNIVAQYNAWANLYRNKLTHKIPIILIIQIVGGNPIELGFLNKKYDELYVINDPVHSKSILSSDTCFNYYKAIEILRLGYAQTISVTDRDIDNFTDDIVFQHCENFDYSSLSVFAAYKKYRDKLKKDEKVVLIITSGRRNSYES